MQVWRFSGLVRFWLVFLLFVKHFITDCRLIRICRIQLLCLLFPFSTGNSFLGKICTRSQNCLFSMKTNSNMQNSMVVFTFSVSDRICPFCANLVQKIKIFSLSWNLIPTLIQICWIYRWCSLFPFSTGNKICVFIILISFFFFFFFDEVSNFRNRILNDQKPE